MGQEAESWGPGVMEGVGRSQIVSRGTYPWLPKGESKLVPPSHPSRDPPGHPQVWQDALCFTNGGTSPLETPFGRSQLRGVQGRSVDVLTGLLAPPGGDGGFLPPSKAGCLSWLPCPGLTHYR